MADAARTGNAIGALMVLIPLWFLLANGCQWARYRR
jgi:hypothetical protein